MAGTIENWPTGTAEPAHVEPSPPDWATGSDWHFDSGGVLTELELIELKARLDIAYVRGYRVHVWMRQEDSLV